MCTYLRRAWASVSNGDTPHGTTADTRYTAASSGTNFKEGKRERGYGGQHVGHCVPRLFSVTHSPGPPQ